MPDVLTIKLCIISMGSAMTATLETNKFLASLSSEARYMLFSDQVSVELAQGTILHQPMCDPTFAFFLIKGLATTAVKTHFDGVAEVGMVGADGVLGATTLLGPAQTPAAWTMSISGAALRIPFDVFRHLFWTVEEIHCRVLEFVQHQYLVLSQAMGCQTLHDAEQRLARWLLVAQDLTQAVVIPLTQEQLGGLLGTRRTTITMAATSLQEAGCISYARGRLQITNRLLLEQKACSCYTHIASLYKTLYGAPVTPFRSEYPLLGMRVMPLYSTFPEAEK